MNSINHDHGFIGTGTPYFVPDAPDAATLYFGNPISAKIALSSETKTRKSRRKHDAGAVLDGITTPNAPEVTLQTDTFQPLTWAMAMMGTSAEQTVTAQTVADEQGKARLTGYHKLKHDNIDPDTLQVKKTGSSIDKSKYVLIAEAGLVQITDPSAASEGDDLTYDYKTKQVKKIVIDGARVSSFKGSVFIDGQNDVTKQRCKLIIPNVTLAVDGEFDWFSDDFNSVTMKGTAAVGKNGEAPYTVELYE